MPYAFLILIAALICIYLEFFLPGGILALIGSFLYLISIVFAFFDVEVDSIYKVIFAIASAFSVMLLIYIALKQIKNRKSSNDFFLQTDQEGFKASSYRQDLIGKEGISLCDLKPSGYILIDEQKFSAIADTGYIDANRQIVVIAGSGGNLLVKHLETR